MYPTSRNPASGVFVEQQIKSLQHIGLDVDVMHLDRDQRGFAAYVGIRRNVCARIQQSHPDLIHVMYGGVMAAAVTRSVNTKPTVVSFCGSDLLGQHLSGPLRRVMAGYGVLASHRAAKRATAVVVKSKNLSDALPCGVDRQKVRVIPNGVDLEVFKPLNREECRSRLGWNDETFHVLFPTNAGDPCKRFRLARAAVDELRHFGIQTELHELTGVPHRHVPIWLNASDALLLSSLHEGSPNIVKEALACDLPVVSVDVGDVRQRIQAIDGCHIANATAGELAMKLELVYSGKRRVAGRAQIQNLSLQSVALQLKDLYRRLLQT
jgi:glycosyltransferase involved in cell wall biosynthesis